MRWSDTEMIGGKRGSGAHWQGRNRPEVPAGEAESGELFRQPGGTIWRGKKGKMERGARAFYRRRRGEETAEELKELKRGVTAHSGLVTGGISVRRKKKVSVLTRGSHQSAGVRGEIGYRFGFLRWAADSFRYWAENRPRGPFLIFISSFLFSFLFSLFLQILFKSDPK
jgi:hypothetical protein